MRTWLGSLLSNKTRSINCQRVLLLRLALLLSWNMRQGASFLILWQKLGNFRRRCRGLTSIRWWTGCIICMIRDMRTGTSNLKIYYLPRLSHSKSRILGFLAWSEARTALGFSRPSSELRATWLRKSHRRIMMAERLTSLLLELFCSSCTLAILPSKNQQSPIHTTN